MSAIFNGGLTAARHQSFLRFCRNFSYSSRSISSVTANHNLSVGFKMTPNEDEIMKFIINDEEISKKQNKLSEIVVDLKLK
jgi:hypothetical protein